MYRIFSTISILLIITAFECKAQNSLESIQRSFENYSLNDYSEKLYIHLDKNHYSLGDTVWFKAYLVDGTLSLPDTLSKIIYVDFIRKVDGAKIHHKLLRNENGFAWGEFNIPDTLKGGVYELVSYTNWMRNFPNSIHRKEIIIQTNYMFQDNQSRLEEIADLQFFPEGGNLIANLQNRVAFKAVNKYGKGINFNAFIISEHNDTVATIFSQHLGMGSFIFQPKAGEKYFAQIKNQSKKLKFQLPVASPNGYTFFVDNLSNKESIKVITKNNYSTKDRPVLICQQRGIAYFALLSESEGNSFLWMLPRNKIENNGVVQLTLFNGQGMPQCERLVYNKKEIYLNISIASDKSEYGPKEKVELSIHVEDQDDYPVEGNFSLSVTDLNQVMTEANDNNIVNYLQLTSDVIDMSRDGIKGAIEQPDYYFDNSNTDAQVHLDVLLMTQGWRRFLWSDVLQSRNQAIQYKIEQGIMMHGKALFSNGKVPPKPIDLTLVTYEQNGKQEVLSSTTDQTGDFTFYGINGQRETKIFLQAKKDISRDVYITIDKPDLPIYKPRPEYADPLFFKSKFSPSLYYKRVANDPDAKQLKDIVITGRRVEKEDSRKSLYKGTNVTTVTINQASWGAATNVLQMLQGRVAGLQINLTSDGSYIPIVRGPTSLIPGGIGPSGPGTTVAILVDGILTNLSFINAIPPSSVESIDVITHPVALYNAQGVINILTKNGNSLNLENLEAEVAANMLATSIQAYDVPREFYISKYPLSDNPSVPKVPDLRSTLFWIPVIKTDWEGNAKVVFWNSEESTTIRATLEGISKDGKPGRITYDYKIKE